MPAPPQHRFLEGPAQAESLADLPWWEVTKDPQLQALVREGIAQNLDLRVATARVEEARAEAGIAKSFLFPEVNLTGGYGAQQARGSRSRPGDEEPEDVPELERRLRALLGDRSLRPHPAREGGGVRPVPGHRAGPSRRPDHAGGRRGLDLLPAPRAGPRARDREAHAPAQRRDGRLLRSTGCTGGVSNRLELDQAIANRAFTASTIPEIERQIATHRERAQRAAGPPAGTDRARRSAHRPVPAAAGAGRDARRAARAPARRGPGGAVAGRRQRQRRRGQGALLPDDLA